MLFHKVYGRGLTARAVPVDIGVVAGVKAQAQAGVVHQTLDLGFGLDHGLDMRMVDHLDAVRVPGELAHAADLFQKTIPDFGRKVALFLAVLAHVGLVHGDEVLGTEGGKALAQRLDRRAEVVKRGIAVKLVAARARADLQPAPGQLFAQYGLVRGQVTVRAQLQRPVACRRGLVQENIPRRARGRAVRIPDAPRAGRGCDCDFTHVCFLLVYVNISDDK